MLGRRRIAVALIAGSALAAAPAFAAEEAAPVPMPCTGYSIVDKAGDGYEPNWDITGVFFRYVPGADGKPVLTANMQIVDLNKDISTDTTSAAWMVEVDVDGDDYHYFVASLNKLGEITYRHGGYTASGPTAPGGPGVDPGTETTGRFIEGKNGIIEIVIPESVELKSLKNPTAFSRFYLLGNENTPSLGIDGDVAPDTGTGTTFDVAECPAEAPVTAPLDAPVVAPVIAPALPAGPAALPVRLGTPKLVAKKLKRKKSIALKLVSDTGLTDLNLTLTRAGKTVGTGTLADLAGSGTAKLRLTKRLKKGTYALSITGNDATGSASSTTLSVRVR